MFSRRNFNVGERVWYDYYYSQSSLCEKEQQEDKKNIKMEFFKQSSRELKLTAKVSAEEQVVIVTKKSPTLHYENRKDRTHQSKAPAYKNGNSFESRDLKSSNLFARKQLSGHRDAITDLLAGSQAPF